MRKIQKEFGRNLVLEWRSFFLRPRPRETRDLDRFKAYTRGWTKLAEKEPDTVFTPWESDQGPPSHSIPPHLVARAALTIGPKAYEMIHERLYRAYFSENRDITDDGVLFNLWTDLGFPRDIFEKRHDSLIRDAVSSQHDEAVDRGITGVPAYIFGGSVGPFMGAQSLEIYRRWIQRVDAGDDLRFALFSG